jgi:hypothetical protein
MATLTFMATPMAHRWRSISCWPRVSTDAFMSCTSAQREREGAEGKLHHLFSSDGKRMSTHFARRAECQLEEKFEDINEGVLK